MLIGAVRLLVLSTTLTWAINFSNVQDRAFIIVKTRSKLLVCADKIKYLGQLKTQLSSIELGQAWGHSVS